MASTDLDWVAYLVDQIETIDAIGLVYSHDVWSAEDLAALLISDIAGKPTLRAWWITGPTMSGREAVQTPGGHLERTWTVVIHGVEGLTEGGGSLETLRANALAVSDLLDGDWDLGGNVHRASPSRWLQEPEARVVGPGVGVAYVEIEKSVVTFTTP